MHIYVISDGDSCKIGVAGDINDRISGLQTASPKKLNVGYRLKCKNSRVAYKIEKIAHKILSGKRLEGEWFSCSTEEAILSISEAVLEFAASDYGFVDMPRGGEMALSSKATRYVRHMCTRYGLKPSDVMDEALVEYFGPIVDGEKTRAGMRISASDDPARKAIIEAIKKGSLPVSRLRRKKGLGTLDDRSFNLKMEEITMDGYIDVVRTGKGNMVIPGQKLNSSDFPH
jgi:hypothetical protein